MSAKKILAAVICFFLLLAADMQAGASRAGASVSDGSLRLAASDQRRAARRRRNKKMSRRAAQGQLQEGVWGGPHVRMSVREGGAALEFDCAQGEIAEPLKTDADGRFDLRGTFTRESPGPIRLDIKPVAKPARYAGRVEGGTMSFRIKLTDTNRETETFTLTRGSEGRLWKCR